jgi:hypothetical protein
MDSEDVNKLEQTQERVEVKSTGESGMKPHPNTEAVALECCNYTADGRTVHTISGMNAVETQVI